MTPVSAGPARLDECGPAAALVTQTYVDDGLVPADSPYVDQLRDGEARWRDAEVIVARDADGTVVGTVTFCLPGTAWAEISRPGEAEFRMLAVAPQVRRRGIGRLLVAECLTRAARAEASLLVMSTTPRMAAAHRMYQALGFRRLPERDWSPRRGVELWAYARPPAG